MNVHYSDDATTLESAIERATQALQAVQRPDGHFVFDLEADAAIPAEYIVLKHFLGEIDDDMERRTGVYLRRLQESHGGWPKLAGGPLDISASVKAYFALKIIGDSVDAPHMRKARHAIHAAGGAIGINMFTRTILALFGIVPWRAVPVMPVELMHAPRWFPIHIFKMSYWARCTLVPLLVIMALKPKAVNPRQIAIDELFLVPPHHIERWPKTANQTGPWGLAFAAFDRLLRIAQPLFPRKTRTSAIEKAVAFLRTRLNGEDGVGAIYPSIIYTVVMFKILGLPEDHADMVTARSALDKLLARNGAEGFCQPCLSPVWDTVLAAQALMEVRPDESEIAVPPLEWLRVRQVLDLKGDWSFQRPDLRPGGWPFQYANPYYVDLDDTAVVVMTFDRQRRTTGTDRYDEAIARAREWIVGMQSANGGFASFDADNTSFYLNHIPYADHGALLDPPTSDVTARCISMLGQLGERPGTSGPLRRAVAFLESEQREDGSWFGRWGINYVYGTWSALCALVAIDQDVTNDVIRRAIAWLVEIQNADGGWGEDDNGYALDYDGYRPAPSTASQTAWAVLGLMAVGELHSASVRRGIQYLEKTQAEDGFWDEPRYTAVGFPRVFYLRYGGYAKFFPLWALARYRNLKSGARVERLGM